VTPRGASRGRINRIIAVTANHARVVGYQCDQCDRRLVTPRYPTWRRTERNDNQMRDIGTWPIFGSTNMRVKDSCQPPSTISRSPGREMLQRRVAPAIPSRGDDRSFINVARIMAAVAPPRNTRGIWRDAAVQNSSNEKTYVRTFAPSLVAAMDARLPRAMFMSNGGAVNARFPHFPPSPLPPRPSPLSAFPISYA
jgi:hypothetical protein